MYPEANRAVTEFSEAGSPNCFNSTVLNKLLYALRKASTELERGVLFAEKLLDFECIPNEYRVKPCYKRTLEDLFNHCLNARRELVRCHSTANQKCMQSNFFLGAEITLDEHQTEGFVFRLPRENHANIFRLSLANILKYIMYPKNGSCLRRRKSGSRKTST